MPKRVGNLWVKVCSLENCIQASLLVEKNHNGNLEDEQVIDRVFRRAENAHRDLKEKTWVGQDFKVRTIYDGHRKKERDLRIPTLYDQTVHHSIMNVLQVEILKRNYHYNCGSIPKAGQSRACDGLKKYLKEGHYKYAFQWDIRHFYENVTHEGILSAFKRFIKDPEMLWGISAILDSMLLEEERSEEVVHRLAIGFNPAHWFANTVLNRILNLLRAKCSNYKNVQYMDDGVMLSNNKRDLHKLCDTLQSILTLFGLYLKPNYQIYKIKGRGIRYLSYVFHHTYSVVRKYLLYRISKVVRHGVKLTEHYCMSILSYLGILKHCNSYNLRKNLIYVKYKVCKLKEVVSNGAKFRNSLQRRAVTV